MSWSCLYPWCAHPSILYWLDTYTTLSSLSTLAGSREVGTRFCCSRLLRLDYLTTNSTAMNKQSHSLSSKGAHALELSKWLLSPEFNWNIFATFTTEYRLTRNSARSTIERLNKQITCTLPDALRSFWVAERYALDNRYHLHALYETQFDTQKLIQSIEKNWSVVSRFKGLQSQNLIMVEEYKKEERGASYLTKTIRWDDAEYDLFLYNPSKR